MSTSADKVLVTGAAGFIGFHVSKRLINDGYEVTGIDNLNDYYDVELKKARVKILSQFDNFRFVKLDISDASLTRQTFDKNDFRFVINLAAQAGVRHSLKNPGVYIDSNITGFLNILEGCRHGSIEHLIYASSSSVYGANTRMPFSVKDSVNHPLSLYAATKKSNELMAHSYSSLFNLPTTGLRFFSAYGPWGRPDMALFIFTRAILEGSPIDVYNQGKMKRDFTFIDDIVQGLVGLLGHPPKPNLSWSGMNPDPSSSLAPYQIFNVGNNNPIQLLDFIEILERKLEKKAIKNLLPMQVGDVDTNFADISELTGLSGYMPKTSVDEGVSLFVDWYKEYYKIS